MIKENRLQEYAKLEKHIMEARAKSLAYEEREEEKRRKACDDPDAYGIPEAKSYFTYCVDEVFLKDHDLLVPSDYKVGPKPPFVPIPKSRFKKIFSFKKGLIKNNKLTKKKTGNKELSFLRETKSSVNRLNRNPLLPPIGSARTLNIDDIEFMHKSGSDETDALISFRSYDDGEESSDVNLESFLLSFFHCC